MAGCRPAAAEPSSVVLPMPHPPLANASLIQHRRSLLLRLLTGLTTLAPRMGLVGDPNTARMADFVGQLLEDRREAREDTNRCHTKARAAFAAFLQDYKANEMLYIGRLEPQGAQVPTLLLRYVQLNLVNWFCTMQTAASLAPAPSFQSALTSMLLGNVSWVLPSRTATSNSSPHLPPRSAPLAAPLARCHSLTGGNPQKPLPPPSLPPK
jgi:hypothetical protein